MIIVVDDDDLVRSLVSGILSREGAIVFACSDAFEALNAVRNRSPDVVLSDIMMPERDGFQLLGDIRALGPYSGARIPVVAMTALGHNGIHEQIRQAGFQIYLLKPFRPDKLVEAVLSILNR